MVPVTTKQLILPGSLNVPIEHHPTIRYMVYNGYYKVMSNIPKMGHLPTPVLSAISHDPSMTARHPTSQQHLQIRIHLGQHLLTMPSPRVGIATVDVPGVVGIVGIEKLDTLW